MKLKEVFEKSVQFFKDKKFDTARLDAELLISHALKVERVQIYVKYEQPLKEAEIALCRESVRRRGLGEPVAYITGEKGFYGEIFNVGTGALIPRPETEIIVEEALNFLKTNKFENPKIADLGAGTGCIGLSILKNTVHAKLLSIEKSAEAFRYLEENVQKLNLQERCEVKLADLETFDFSTLGQLDVVVSNPPYIANNDPQLEANVKKFEPAESLFAQDQGLHFIKDWMAKSSSQLSPGGLLMFEIGSTQGQQVLNFAKDLNIFSQVQIIKDLSGLDRTLKCVR